MVRRRLLYPGVLVLALALVGVAGMLSAQTAVRPLPAISPMEEILAEIKGLRADMAQSSSAGIRAQLLVGRLQLQEQRINNVVVQLAEARTQLSSVRRDVGEIENRLHRIQEEQQRVLTQPPTQMSTAERADIEGQLKMQLADAQREIVQRRQNELELVTREGDLANLFSLEQARWSEFNDRLDALERSLPQR